MDMVKSKNNGFMIDGNKHDHDKCLFFDDICSSKSLFLLIFGKSGNNEFNKLFLNFFTYLFYSVSSSDNHDNNHLENHVKYESFLSLCNNTVDLTEKFKYFIKHDVAQTIKVDLVELFISDVISNNSYSNFDDELLFVSNSLRDVMSKSIDLLYPIWITDSIVNSNEYKFVHQLVGIAFDFHYVSCDILVKNQQLKLSESNVSLTDIEKKNFSF